MEDAVATDSLNGAAKTDHKPDREYPFVADTADGAYLLSPVINSLVGVNSSFNNELADPHGTSLNLKESGAANACSSLHTLRVTASSFTEPEGDTWIGGEGRETQVAPLSTIVSTSPTSTTPSLLLSTSACVSAAFGKAFHPLASHSDHSGVHFEKGSTQVATVDGQCVKAAAESRLMSESTDSSYVDVSHSSLRESLSSNSLPLEMSEVVPESAAYVFSEASQFSVCSGLEPVLFQEGAKGVMEKTEVEAEPACEVLNIPMGMTTLENGHKSTLASAAQADNETAADASWFQKDTNSDVQVKYELLHGAEANPFALELPADKVGHDSVLHGKVGVKRNKFTKPVSQNSSDTDSTASLVSRVKNRKKRGLSHVEATQINRFVPPKPESAHVTLSTRGKRGPKPMKRGGWRERGRRYVSGLPSSTPDLQARQKREYRRKSLQGNTVTSLPYIHPRKDVQKLQLSNQTQPLSNQTVPSSFTTGTPVNFASSEYFSKLVNDLDFYDVEVEDILNFREINDNLGDSPLKGATTPISVPTQSSVEGETGNFSNIKRKVESDANSSALQDSGESLASLKSSVGGGYSIKLSKSVTLQHPKRPGRPSSSPQRGSIKRTATKGWKRTINEEKKQEDAHMTEQETTDAAKCTLEELPKRRPQLLKADAYSDVSSYMPLGSPLQSSLTGESSNVFQLQHLNQRSSARLRQIQNQKSIFSLPNGVSSFLKNSQLPDLKYGGVPLYSTSCVSPISYTVGSRSAHSASFPLAVPGKALESSNVLQDISFSALGDPIIRERYECSRRKMQKVEQYLDICESMYFGKSVNIKNDPAYCAIFSDPYTLFPSSNRHSPNSSSSQNAVANEYDKLIDPSVLLVRSLILSNNYARDEDTKGASNPNISINDKSLVKSSQGVSRRPQTGNASKLMRTSYPKTSPLEMLISPLRKPHILDLWGPKEVCLFEAAICKYGKDFNKIQRIIESKSTKDIVDFYYLWKKSNRYSAWKEFRSLSETIPTNFFE